MTGIVDFRAELLDELGTPISDANPLAVSAGGGALSSYALNDFADGSPMYIGKTKLDGTWLIQRYTTSGEMRYANLSNNAGVAPYTTAWVNRASLTYGLFHTLIGI